jgi:drug/metabolite transporter (DMT)-like permease
MRFCYVWAYRAGDASAVEVGSVALLVWGAVVGFALFGEVPAPRVWIGALIMIVGIGSCCDRVHAAAWQSEIEMIRFEGTLT